MIDSQWQKIPLNKLVLWLLVVVLSYICLEQLFLFILFLSPVLAPFMIAALFAYLGDPLVDKLELRGMSRTVSVILVFIVIIICFSIVLLFLIPLIELQIVALFRRLPQDLEWVRAVALPWLDMHLGINEQMLNVAMIREMASKHWQEAGGFATMVIGSVSRSGIMVVALFANLILIPVVTFYLLRDWDHLVAKIHQLLPRSIEPVVSRLAKESDSVLAAFLRGQMLVMTCLALIYSIGLRWVGLDLGILIGMVAGVVSFVPYLGFIVGFLMATVASIMQFHDVLHLIYVLIVFGVGQLVEGMFLTPLLVGDRIGLHPVSVIFAVLVGGHLFGFVGVLLALPMAAVIAVLMRYSLARYLDSTIYQQARQE